MASRPPASLSVRGPVRRGRGMSTAPTHRAGRLLQLDLLDERIKTMLAAHVPAVYVGQWARRQPARRWGLDD
jgi:hypothetical protein